MTYKLQLGRYLDDCPVIWQKFINSWPHSISLKNGLTTQEVNEELSKYNAKLCEIDISLSYVMFDSESDFIIFKLRFL